MKVRFFFAGGAGAGAGAAGSGAASASAARTTSARAARAEPTRETETIGPCPEARETERRHAIEGDSARAPTRVERARCLTRRPRARVMPPAKLVTHDMSAVARGGVGDGEDAGTH